MSEQLCPYYDSQGKERDLGKDFWNDVHSRLAMELGLKSLSATYYSYETNWNGKPYTQSGLWPMHRVCENWMLKNFDGSQSADQFIKDRLSPIEIGFRRRDMEIASENERLPNTIQEARRGSALHQVRTIRLPGDPGAGVIARNSRVNAEFQSLVEELNTRFRQAGHKLSYHNGFIQRSGDPLLERQIDKPFWALVSDAQWKNVDTDMKEALDRRDTESRDAAFYAARALESTIKIISDQKAFSHGKEKGAHNYIDNLAAKKSAFISEWEASSLKDFFTKLRNPMGHGPGNQEMLILNKQQTDWAIETCMSWIKSLIRRME